MTFTIHDAVRAIDPSLVDKARERADARMLDVPDQDAAEYLLRMKEDRDTFYDACGDVFHGFNRVLIRALQDAYADDNYLAMGKIMAKALDDHAGI